MNIEIIGMIGKVVNFTAQSKTYQGLICDKIENNGNTHYLIRLWGEYENTDDLSNENFTKYEQSVFSYFDALEIKFFTARNIKKNKNNKNHQQEEEAEELN